VTIAGASREVTLALSMVQDIVHGEQLPPLVTSSGPYLRIVLRLVLPCTSLFCFFRFCVQELLKALRC
jgi:hypothetical protein